LNAGKSPIIVGGTNYYVESVLWNQLISDESDALERKRGISVSIKEQSSFYSKSANKKKSEKRWVVI